MRRYFITGTDTDCGKTYVTAQLINYFANSVAIKPVASGCMIIENQLVSSDAQQLKQHNNIIYGSQLIHGDLNYQYLLILPPRKKEYTYLVMK